MYATDAEVEMAKAIGFEVTKSTHSGHKFRMYDRYIWSVGWVWITADLNNGSYINHKQYRHLDEALKRSL